MHPKGRKGTKTMKIVDVLGRIYGLSHLLSSERSNIVQYSRVNVKDFLRIFAEKIDTAAL